ncbi:SDR family oxidoreductase [Nonomuraea sp. NN258]|uniref:NAD(P)-dependent oxidoreductase n=1 Tax=Nonomuraea antri TaxID=2730852 RepID=UPI0015681614|nr:NAD(P)-binding oxidoreductase [Nonomuraea antri]NRQ32201.1 SDR family oxidoreductase [Nonomuraea antri]
MTPEEPTRQKMRIAVVGATSRTGLHLLAEAARRGHEVAAATRRPGALPADTPARTVTGDGRDPRVVTEVIAGADAVIAIVNGGDRADPHRAEHVLRTVTAAMAAEGVRRLVVTSAYPIVGERPRLAIWLLNRLLATSYADVRAMEALVRATDLDWTIARLNRLTDKPPTGRVTCSGDLLDSPRPMSRADSAAALLDLAESRERGRTAVNLCGA